MPTELDVIIRRIRQGQMEKVALELESDQASKDRLAKLEADLAEWQETCDAMTARWRAEKNQIDLISSLKTELEERRVDAERFEREGDLAQASAIRYGELPRLEGEIAAATQELEGLQRDHRFLKEEVDAEDIAEVVSRTTGVPVSKLLEGEVEKLLHLEHLLEQRVIGQKPAVAAVANAIRRSRSGLADSNRPIGSFLFLGPTGVGKTELARALAEFLFDDERAMVRIDMSEYMERHSVSRLVGAPPGYIGFEEGGQLTEAVRRRPYAVVLLDELEKAHQDVFNLLLQVLEDGRLTDGQGRTVDFTNVVLIMTSNLSVAPEQYFKPEFVNRIDEIVRFASLSEEDLRQIIDVQLRRLASRMQERGLGLEVTEQAATYLAHEGFDPEFGARPLRRVLQRRVEDPLAMAILEGRFAAGETVKVGLDGEEITFEKG